jgi:hypothetical protein
MKRLYITLVVIFSISVVNAQSFGFKIGGNISSINSNIFSSDSLINQMKPGLNAGLVFEYNPVKHFGIRAEALFTQKGYSYNVEANLDTSDIVTDISVNINYIEVPILLKLNFGPAYLAAGPYFGYALSGKQIATVTVDGQELAKELYTNYGQVPSNNIFKSGEFNGDNVQFSKTDIGLNIGFGVKFLKFFVEGRYGYGLTNIENYENMPAEDFKKNYTISLSAGMLLGK